MRVDIVGIPLLDFGPSLPDYGKILDLLLSVVLTQHKSCTDYTAFVPPDGFLTPSRSCAGCRSEGVTAFTATPYEYILTPFWACLR